jgi:RF-1 domain
VRGWRRLTDEALRADCDLQTFRGSGPGGQKRNKTSSGVRLVHRPTGISASATGSRSQQANLTATLRRLRLQMAFELRCVPPDECTSLKLVSPRSTRYAEEVAVVLDQLAARAGSLAPTAEALGISTAKLTAFLAAEPIVLTEVNRQRALQALHPLRKPD